MARLFTRDAAGRASAEILLPHCARSEETAPRIKISSIRLVSPDTVVAIAAAMQYGALTLDRSGPVRLVLQRIGGARWIASHQRAWTPLRIGAFPKKSLVKC